MSFLSALLLTSSPAAAIVAADRVDLSALEVRLDDVARWQGPVGLGEVVIARLPQGRPAVRLSRMELAGLIRRRVPGIEMEPVSSGSILLVAAVKAVSAGKPCLELTVAKVAGDELLAGDVAPIACPERLPPSALRFDAASGANIALRPLEAGSVIPFVRLAETPALRRGEKLTLSSTVGPVTIERPVTLAQHGRPGDRSIFVRTQDGEILAAPIAGAQSK